MSLHRIPEGETPLFCGCHKDEVGHRAVMLTMGDDGALILRRESRRDDHTLVLTPKQLVDIWTGLDKYKNAANNSS